MMNPSPRNPWLDDLPAVNDIIEEAMEILSFKDPSRIQSVPPHEAVAALEKKCHEIYTENEERVRDKFRRGEYGRYRQRDFETSLANSRRVRAGRTLELIFRRMLDLFSIPHERPRDLGEAEFDFVIPDMLTLKRDPERAVLISLKRKVRERWKLTVGDAYILREIYGYPDSVWFVSLFDPPVDAVRIFLKLKIRVYVPDGSFTDILKQLKDLAEEELKRLRPFSRIFEDLKPFTSSVQKRLDELG